jgi:ribose transport system ATP-binding protein
MNRGVLQVENLSKNYGATIALKSVSLSLVAGEVHAVLGENGAGKSTLVKILSGVNRQQFGQMVLAGAAYRPRSITDARSFGVSNAFQELSLIPYLTVGENLLLPRASRTSFWPESRSGIIHRAAGILDEWEITDIPPDAVMEDLSLAERRRIEITRALSHATNILILDEPTAALPDPAWLFRQIRRVTANRVAVMYISHRLGEVREICQSATVLRNGTTIRTVDLKGVDDDEIFSMMVGRKADHVEIARGTGFANAKVLVEARNLSVGKVHSLDLTLKAGEIVGLAALDGQGQQDLLRALGGIGHPWGGQILVDGKPVSLGSPQGALKAGGGIAFVPEERKTEGIFECLSAASNIALPKISKASKLGVVYRKLEMKVAARVAGKVGLADRYLDFSVGNPSGGNQQKVLLARALMTGAKCLVLFDPARGVDVGTKQSIYAMMRDFAKQGGTILFYSSELSELVELGSRCLVMYGGQIVAEVPRERMSEEVLLAAAHGHVRPRKGRVA